MRTLPAVGVWDLGTDTEFPVLRVDFDGNGTATWEEFGAQTRALPYYDNDEDGLIEIRTRAQLSAIRYDLDGDGAPDPAHEEAYKNAFGRDFIPRQSTACLGYELVADLDLAGMAWAPIGNQNSGLSGIFEGNGHTLANLEINSGNDYIGLFAKIDGGGMVCNIGLPSVQLEGGDHAGALAGLNAGIVYAVYATGAVRGNTNMQAGS